MSGVGTFIVVLTATTAVGRDCLMFIRSLIFNLGIKIKDPWVFQSMLDDLLGHEKRLLEEVANIDNND